MHLETHHKLESWSGLPFRELPQPADSSCSTFCGFHRTIGASFVRIAAMDVQPRKAQVFVRCELFHKRCTHFYVFPVNSG